LGSRHARRAVFGVEERGRHSGASTSDRPARLVRVAAFTILITALSFYVQPHLAENFGGYPWGYAFPVLTLAGLIGVRLSDSKQAELMAFLASVTYLCGMLLSAAFGVYPFVLASNGDPSLGLTIYNSAAPGYGLIVGLRWWILGMIFAVGYFVFVYRHFAGEVRLEDS
jgi:cytochrome bd ubiquinol oxidase subunit II